jgi:tRNA threonylcarbamoyladenosine modification (KEOPS) complex Cgi121 subunit
VTYVAAAGQRDFDVPFPYINRSHVKVRVNGTPVVPFSWPSATRLRLPAAVAAGAAIEIERQTPVEEQLVKFQDGNILTAEDLNIAVQQLLYKQQEVTGLYDRSLRAAQVRLGDTLGIVTDPANVAQELAELVLEDQVLDNFRNRIADIDLNAESILAQALDIDRVDQAVVAANGSIASLQLSTDNAIAALSVTVGDVDTRLGTLRNDHDTLVGVVDALAGGDPGTGVATLIQEETNARIAGDTALANTFSLLGAKSGDNLSFILNLNTTRVSPTETLSQRLSALSATDGANAAAITSEQTARINAVNALTSDITTLYSRMDDNEAAITTESTARSSGDAALASQLTTLTSRVGQAEADIVTNQTAAASADSAFAAELALLGARNGTSTAFVINTATAQIGGGETLATRFSALSAADGANVAAIQSEQTARIDADNALTSSVNSLGTRLGTAEAAIVTEQNARIAGDSAEASARAELAARVTSAEAAITTEQTARAAGDSAIVADLSLIGARNAAGTGWILDLSKVQVSPTTTLGTRLSGIDTAIGSNAAAIVNEQTARSSADSALASDISTLTTTVNGNTASVSTLQSSVNGLQARYGVSLDVNGYVTGFVQNNDGTSGDFTILADRFAIVTPGAAPTVPFEVSGGVVRIKQAAIGNLDVERLNSGALNATITQNGDWNVGTGRIVWDNGTHMKVAGVGFGSAGQFIEWFGPKMDIAFCSEANAISYLKTNGDAYFGGSLSAGILKNSAQSTDTGASSSVTVGPFGTNGNPIQILTWYSAESRNTATYPATSTGVSNWSSAVSAWGATPTGPLGSRTVDATKTISCTVTVRLDRTVGSSTTAGWATLTITGGSERLTGYEPLPGDGTTGELVYTRTVAGTITSTDNAGGTQDRTFTATITTRTNATLGTIIRQSVSVLATEE